MRKVDRTQAPAPDILIATTQLGPRETEALLAFYANPANRNRRYVRKLKAYSDRSVRTALQTLFQGKCAYCESRYLDVTPDDIEHWRPKARIVTSTGEVIRAGYYWLAAHWENLFPSCPKCNRANSQEIAGVKGRRTAGKRDLFPLEDETRRARQPGDEANESPLLLNPCVDDPSSHLTFPTDHDRLGMILPKEDAHGVRSNRGAASIDIYALNRKPLVDERREFAMLIQQQVKRVQRAMLHFQNATNLASKAAATTELQEELTELRRLRSDRQPYVLLATQLIDPFLRAFGATTQ